jgi:thioredoxin 1
MPESGRRPGMAGLLRDVDDASFQSLVEQHENVVVDAWAPWCAPCHRIEPSLQELAGKFEGRVVIAKLNTDENMRTATQLQIMGMPTLVLFRNGKRVAQVVGAQPKPVIEGAMVKAFGLD